MSESDETTSDGRVPDLQGLGDLVERLSIVAQRTGLASLIVKTDDFTVRLTTGAGKTQRKRERPSQHSLSSDSVPVVDVATQVDGYVVTSPMVGTYYHATSPADPPLVKVGDRVEEGQLIGIIEAMKIMNEINSDRSGTVLEVCAVNATAVEYGSPLIRLGP